MNCCFVCSVGPRLLKLGDVDGMLVLRKGFEPNEMVVGFKAAVVVNALISTDGLAGDSEDKR